MRVRTLAAARDSERRREAQRERAAEQRSLAEVAARRGPRAGSMWSFATAGGEA